ncbi:hypothetical protein ABT354_15840 [Streptomyces sp. NPDC000594]|uniref:hypothetical protein n=1 Tax=Streptomyces sp. NPDC000594 TaxID=3154261 RepID=UPI003322948C
MHGAGLAQPQPGRRPATATLFALRGLFVLLSLISLGTLAWAAMLRVAVLRKRPLDWVLFWASLVLAVTFFVVVAEFGEQPDPPKGEPKEPDVASGLDLVAIWTMVAMAIGIPVHYLVADIRHFQRPAPPPGYGPPTVPTAPPAYGYPQPPPPVPGYGAPSPYTAPAPRPGGETPRIDQVRAELDELSDYLRREQGR